jgi:hypothetical protein
MPVIHLLPILLFINMCFVQVSRLLVDLPLERSYRFYFFYFFQRLVFPTDFTLLSPYDSAEKVGQSSEPQHMERLRKGSVLDSWLLGQQRQALGYSHLSEIIATRLSIRSLPS